MPYNHLEDLEWLGNHLNYGPDSYRLEEAFDALFPRNEDRARAIQILRHSTVVGPARLEWDEAVKSSFVEVESLMKTLGSPEAIDDLMYRISLTLNQKFEKPITTRSKWSLFDETNALPYPILIIPAILQVEPTRRLKPLFELYKQQALSDEKTSQETYRKLQENFNPAELEIIQRAVEAYGPIKSHLTNSRNILYEVKKRMIESFVTFEPGQLRRPESVFADSTKLAEFLNHLKELVTKLNMQLSVEQV